ncbi:MAG: heavy metal translocating P-type ATPase [Ruminococcaceae bacterium]|nr:heavy metal translocating P-type ATPase [Oscillospiraceae bacterium]
MKKEVFSVTGMSCAACVSHVENAVKVLPGVKSLQVSLFTNSMTVSYDDGVCGSVDIISAVQKAGYNAFVKKDSAPIKGNDESGKIKARLVSSIVLLVILMIIAMQHMLGYSLPWIFNAEKYPIYWSLSQILLTVAVMILNGKFFVNGFKMLFRLSPNMDSLVAIGSGASFLYGLFSVYKIYQGVVLSNADMVMNYSHQLYFESAAMILTLVTVGKFLEARSKKKTSEAITKMIALTPDTAFVIVDGKESEIPISDISVGDIIAVKPGASVPVDGVIESGHAVIDESVLTGESVPVEKSQGDLVSAGTVNLTGGFTFKAVKVGNDTTLSQMIRLVDEASASKVPLAKLADKIASIFVPTVMAIAVVSFVLWYIFTKDFELSLSFGISVLVVSCPCALGLATPAAVMAGVGRGAEYGILIKSGEALETAHKIDTVIVDKTGTLTEGKLHISDVYCREGFSEKELLEIVYGAEKMSEHPVAKAVVEYAKSKGIISKEFQGSFENIPGKGIVISEPDSVAVGNAALMKTCGVFESEIMGATANLNMKGKTVLYVAIKGEIAGVLTASDKAKPDSADAVKLLKSMNIEVVMLTGDNRSAAESIASELGIEKIFAEVLPQNKEEIVRKIKNEGHCVAMIGDGVNDAPALAAADVGMAIGAGTDIAVESADIVLVKNSINDAVAAIKLSKAVVRNIKQNLFWAFIYNIIGIPVAAGALYIPFGIKLSPMLGSAAMSLSSVCVVSNAVRLRKHKISDNELPSDKCDGACAIPDSDSVNIDKNDCKEETDMKRFVVHADGMMCMHCAGRVESAVMAVEGVVEAKVNLDEKRVTVTGGDTCNIQSVKQAITDAGYTVID